MRGARSADQARASAAHHRRHIEQVIEMCMRHEDGVDLGTDVLQAGADSRRIGSDRLIRRDAPKIRAREIGINEERMSAGFELKSIHPEIGDSNPTAACW